MNSEKVVMHTTTDNDPRLLNKDRSMTGSLLDTSSSPLSGRKSRHPSDEDKLTVSNSRLKQNITISLPGTSTVFFISGLDVKVHYVSKTESDHYIRWRNSPH